MATARQCFSALFLEKVAANPNKPFRVTVGAPGTSTSQAGLQLFPIAYRQGDRPFCVGLSFASALHYLGCSKAAVAEQHAAQAYQYSHSKDLGAFADKNEMDYFNEHMHLIVPQLAHGKRMFGQSFDLFSVAGHSLAIVNLRGSDGSVNHAITILHGLIFDACETHALLLTQANLDSCIRDRSSNDHIVCLGVHRALQLHPLPSLMRALLAAGHSRRWFKHISPAAPCEPSSSM